MRIEGLEPTRALAHQTLILACLPIPTYPHLVGLDVSPSADGFLNRRPLLLLTWNSFLRILVEPHYYQEVIYLSYRYGRGCGTRTHTHKTYGPKPYASSIPPIPVGAGTVFMTH